ncbi:MAG: glycosyltransferase family 4 protein, partial [Desulfatitalea sp.]|nr:glycosyltransferase family 4 protein [Desulfatitalea sp.]NNK00600.1 glycosyltransferase family 4 protein [Desulfatitalea sp.]
PQNEVYLSKVKTAIQDNRIEDKIVFLGHIGREQLQTELAGAMCMLLPSLQENAPMAISEAMAVGVPVIASNRCGMPYMIEDNRSGFLVDPDDYTDIGNKIIQLASDESLCSHMGEKGREIALSRFHPDVVAEKTVKAYDRVISGFKKETGR